MSLRSAGREAEKGSGRGSPTAERETRRKEDKKKRRKEEKRKKKTEKKYVYGANKKPPA